MQSIAQPSTPMTDSTDAARRFLQAEIPPLLAQYMRDVSQFPLLTREEEKRLTQQLYERRQRWRDTLISHLLHVPLLLTVRPRVRRGIIPVADLVTSHHTGAAQVLVVALDDLHALCRKMRLCVRQARQQPTTTALSQTAMALRSDMCILLEPWSWQDAFLQQAWSRFDAMMTQASTSKRGQPAVRFMANLGYRFQELAALWRQLHDLLVDIEQAKWEMIARNLRLVVKVVKDYSHNTPLPLEDLIQEGNIGLMRAVDKYDYRRNLKFSTYAVWWIKQAIRRAMLNQTSVIRIPEYLYQTMSQVAKTRSILKAEQGDTPTPQDIAHYLNIPSERVEHSMTVGERRVSSLDWDSLDGEGRPLHESLSDPAAMNAQETAEQSFLRGHVRQALDHLAPREAVVIRRRFGLNGQPEETLREIGLALHLSHERVRQILTKALATLKKQDAELRDFVGSEPDSTRAACHTRRGLR